MLGPGKRRQRQAAGGRPDGDARLVVYCIVPADLAPRLHDPLRKFYRDDPSIRVVVERRGGERRSGPSRRRRTAGPPGSDERRRIRARDGRRVAERRSPVALLAEQPPLPRAARPHAARLRFIERLEPLLLSAEDADSARLVVAFQHGRREAFEALYGRYFDRVYGYIRVGLRDAHEAEDTTQEVFTRVLQRLGDYEVRPEQPFRSWLFVIARNRLISQLGKHARIEVTAPERIDRQRDDRADAPLDILDWTTDPELAMFVERLPLRQRQAIMLEYAVGLSTEEIARVLDSSPQAVRQLQYRARQTLRQRLSAIGRRGDRRRNAPISAVLRHQPVLRRRRFALDSRVGPSVRRAYY